MLLSRKIVVFYQLFHGIDQFGYRERIAGRHGPIQLTEPPWERPP